MCRKLALAATALVALGVAPGPAEAFPWNGRDKATAAPVQPRPEPQAQPAAQTQAQAPAARAKASDQQRAAADRMDPLARAAFWARETTIDPADPVAGVRLAAALRALRSYGDAAAAVQRVLVIQPDNIEALLESARVSIAQNQGFYAVAPARRVQALTPGDWRAASLLGVALEQAQRDDEAAAAHAHALALAPSNPTVLSNAAMFYAGHGDRVRAEAMLRQAAADPSATVAVRQNLALVLGLQGKMAEAERLVRQDLPPETAANNLAYLRAAAAGGPGRSWDSLREPSAAN